MFRYRCKRWFSLTLSPGSLGAKGRRLLDDENENGGAVENGGAAAGVSIMDRHDAAATGRKLLKGHEAFQAGGLLLDHFSAQPEQYRL